MPYLDAAGWVQRGESGQNIVALGGGHGLSATLRALRHITRALTAVVTVATTAVAPADCARRCRSCLPVICAWRWRPSVKNPSGV